MKSGLNGISPRSKSGAYRGGKKKTGIQPSNYPISYRKKDCLGNGPEDCSGEWSPLERAVRHGEKGDAARKKKAELRGVRGPEGRTTFNHKTKKKQKIKNKEEVFTGKERSPRFQRQTGAIPFKFTSPSGVLGGI